MNHLFPCFFSGKILKIDLRINSYRFLKNVFGSLYSRFFFPLIFGICIKKSGIGMKDSQFYKDSKEKNPDCLEDFSDGDLLIQEILESFENFDRVLGITVQEFFSSEDDR
ncbi:hypothetical protein FHG68_14175 [Leptospira weilii]|nr:hypothetical protein FHG67_08060 [Leptospira weilii]QDK27696.1 hypothetical protein FHG68_14175 [Leptospira weilii]